MYPTAAARGNLEGGGGCVTDFIWGGAYGRCWGDLPASGTRHCPTRRGSSVASVLWLGSLLALGGHEQGQAVAIGPLQRGRKGSPSALGAALRAALSGLDRPCAATGGGSRRGGQRKKRPPAVIPSKIVSDAR